MSNNRGKDYCQSEEVKRSKILGWNTFTPDPLPSGRGRKNIGGLTEILHSYAVQDDKIHNELPPEYKNIILQE